MLAKRINFLKNYLVQRKQANKKQCKRKFMMNLKKQEQTKLRIKEPLQI